MNSANPVCQAIFPSAYFPSLAYLSELLKFDSIEIEIHESFPKQTIRNRCTILSANGLLNLTVPVVKIHGNKTKTCDIEIFNNEPWQLKHFRAIESAYKSSPFFDHYIHFFERIFHQKYDNLIDLNEEILQIILGRLKLKKTISFTTTFEKESGNIVDHRSTFNTKSLSYGLHYKPYNQVFSDRFAFQSNVSFLDLLFNEGPNALLYLQMNRKY
jgi:hypothetical protein